MKYKCDKCKKEIDVKQNVHEMYIYEFCSMCMDELLEYIEEWIK